jgi:small basic protein (TIGR04137 family)
MSLDPSLKVKGALARHRNVLTRSERVEKLKEEEKWQESAGVLGLPKVAHRKSHAGRKEKEEEGAEAVAGAPGAAAAPGAAPAAPGAKPTAGAKAGAATPAKGAATPAAKPAGKEKPGKK